MAACSITDGMRFTKVPAAFGCVLLLTAMGAAINLNGRNINLQEVSQADIEEAVATYNENYADKVPGLVATIVSDERVNVNISTDNGNLIYGAVLDGLTVTSVQEGGVENPTLRVYASTDTLEEIAAAENPRKRGVKALKSGEIEYKTVGFFRTIKFGVVTTLIKIFG